VVRVVVVVAMRQSLAVAVALVVYCLALD